MKDHAIFQWEIIAIRKNTWTPFKNLLLIWQIWANISTNLLLRILGFFVCLGFVVPFLIFFSLTWIRHHYRIVANHVQNVRSSPSLGGSYAESVTVAWDDAITGEGLHFFTYTVYLALVALGNEDSFFSMTHLLWHGNSFRSIAHPWVKGI